MSHYERLFFVVVTTIILAVAMNKHVQSYCSRLLDF